MGRKTKHGKSGTRIYRIYINMKHRCYSKKAYSYVYYGARGISVCDEWLKSFEAFQDWALANGYADNLTIDRIDNDGNYCPENCRWADDVTQCNNRQFNFKITFNGKTETLRYWSEITGITKSALYLRIHRRGWSAEKALTTPLRVRKVGEQKNGRN